MNVVSKNGKRYLQLSQQDWLNLGASADWTNQAIILGPPSLTKEADIRDYWNALKNTKNLGGQLESHRAIVQVDMQKLDAIIQALTQLDKPKAAQDAKRIFLTLSQPTQYLVRTFLKVNNPTLPEFHDAILQAVESKIKELKDLNKGQLQYDPGFPQAPAKQSSPYHQVMQLLQSMNPSQLTMISKEITRLLKPKLVPSAVPASPPSAEEPLASTGSSTAKPKIA